MADDREKSIVDLSFKPAEGAEEQRLPFKVLVCDDFSDGRSEDRKEAFSKRATRTVNDNPGMELDATLRAMNIDVGGEATNKLKDTPFGYAAGAEEMLNFSLRLESMKDLTPDGMVERVDVLKRLVMLRRCWEDLKNELVNSSPESLKSLNSVIEDPAQRAALLRSLGGLKIAGKAAK